MHNTLWKYNRRLGRRAALLFVRFDMHTLSVQKIEHTECEGIILQNMRLRLYYKHTSHHITSANERRAISGAELVAYWIAMCAALIVPPVYSCDVVRIYFVIVFNLVSVCLCCIWRRWYFVLCLLSWSRYDWALCFIEPTNKTISNKKSCTLFATNVNYTIVTGKCIRIKKKKNYWSAY